MRSEVFSFTPTSGSNVIILDDDTLEVKAVMLQVCKNGSNVNGSSGFSDAVKNRGKFELYDTVKDSGRSTTYCVYHNKNNAGASAMALRGKVPATGFDTVGEIEFTFDNADAAYTVDGIALGN